MIITTTERVEGKTVVKTIGLVKGNTIRARHLGRDVVALVKNVVGGEISDYTQMMTEAREWRSSAWWKTRKVRGLMPS